MLWVSFSFSFPIVSITSMHFALRRTYIGEWWPYRLHALISVPREICSSNENGNCEFDLVFHILFRCYFVRRFKIKSLLCTSFSPMSNIFFPIRLIFSQNKQQSSIKPTHAQVYLFQQWTKMSQKLQPNYKVSSGSVRIRSVFIDTNRNGLSCSKIIFHSVFRRSNVKMLFYTQLSYATIIIIRSKPVFNQNNVSLYAQFSK